jgi:hypothetical protein
MSLLTFHCPETNCILTAFLDLESLFDWPLTQRQNHACYVIPLLIFLSSLLSFSHIFSLIFAFGGFDGMFKMDFIASTTTSLIEKKNGSRGFLFIFWKKWSARKGKLNYYSIIVCAKAIISKMCDIIESLYV